MLMNILIVGNILKDVYLNLDSRTEHFETDKHHTKWLDLSFDASEHHFFHRKSSLGGAAVSLEVLSKMGLAADIIDSNLTLEEDGLSSSTTDIYRYILIADEKVTYFTPTLHKTNSFNPPEKPYDYIYIDRSANLDSDSINQITSYLNSSPNTKLALYLPTNPDPKLLSLSELANIIFIESNPSKTLLKTPEDSKLIYLNDHQITSSNLSEDLSPSRIDMSTHLSIYSTAAATILGSLILGNSLETSFKLARANVENSRLDTTLSLSRLQELTNTTTPNDNLELIAANLMIKGKGILAADESGGSIQKKFAKLNIPDTAETRRSYRNILLTTPDSEKYLSGVILFDETTHQSTNDGQNFVDYLINHRIIPGIKVDQGLKKYPDSVESYTDGLENLDQRLQEYYKKGLRFAKWRAAFEIHLGSQGQILTPTENAINDNCRILTEYAKTCQKNHIVPIVEPEVVYDGYYSIKQSAEVTAKILDQLFNKLIASHVNLKACILKTSMVIAGKNYPLSSSPTEVGQATAEVLKAHIPTDLAGIVFLSGGQTPEQATDNLAAIIKNGPFPWPITFSFARALQDPALYAWQGNDENTKKAKDALVERLIANTSILN